MVCFCRRAADSLYISHSRGSRSLDKGTPLASSRSMSETYDVGIVGGGPAGLGAALLLARSRRSVAVFDHGKPRNRAARAVHGFLGMDGVTPRELRTRAAKECEGYGVDFVQG